MFLPEIPVKHISKNLPKAPKLEPIFNPVWQCCCTYCGEEWRTRVDTPSGVCPMCKNRFAYWKSSDG